MKITRVIRLSDILSAAVIYSQFTSRQFEFNYVGQCSRFNFDAETLSKLRVRWFDGRILNNIILLLLLNTDLLTTLGALILFDQIPPPPSENLRSRLRTNRILR
jgi:hypothetical protein